MTLSLPVELAAGGRLKGGCAISADEGHQQGAEGGVIYTDRGHGSFEYTENALTVTLLAQLYLASENFSVKLSMK